MLHQTKLLLSAEERQLITNAGIILTKNAVIDKVYQLFGALSTVYQQQIDERMELLDEQLFSVSAKISKGESYQGLPWVMLDQPRYFTKTNVLAIRSFFWWGKLASIILHVSGACLLKYAPQIDAFIQQQLTASDPWYISASADAWEHHFEANNFQPISGQVESVAARPFVKLAKKIPLDQWDELPAFFEAHFTTLLSLVQDHQAPRR